MLIVSVPKYIGYIQRESGSNKKGQKKQLPHQDKPNQPIKYTMVREPLLMHALTHDKSYKERRKQLNEQTFLCFQKIFGSSPSIKSKKHTMG